MQKCVSTNLPSDTSLPRLPGREVAAHTLDQASTDTGASMSPFSASSAGQMTVHGTVHKPAACDLLLLNNNHQLVLPGTLVEQGQPVGCSHRRWRDRSLQCGFYLRLQRRFFCWAQQGAVSAAVWWLLCTPTCTRPPWQLLRALPPCICHVSAGASATFQSSSFGVICELHSWPVRRHCVAHPAAMPAEPLKQGCTAAPVTGATGIQVSRYAL